MKNLCSLVVSVSIPDSLESNKSYIFGMDKKVTLSKYNNHPVENINRSALPDEFNFLYVYSNLKITCHLRWIWHESVRSGFRCRLQKWNRWIRCSCLTVHSKHKFMTHRFGNVKYKHIPEVNIYVVLGLPPDVANVSVAFVTSTIQYMYDYIIKKF